MSQDKLIYLDYAAATPLDPAALAAMKPYLETEFANPSSLYGRAKLAKRAIEESRARVARLLGAKPSEIVWAGSGTESVNLAIQGVLRAHPGAHWVTTSIEHDAVLAIRQPYHMLGHQVTTVPVEPSGIVDSRQVQAAITDQTVLVSVMLANNEIGTIQPIKELGRIISQVRQDRLSRGLNLPLYLHTDACQGGPYLDLHTTRLGADLLSLNGSKVYGPKGTGMLYVRTGTKLEPLIYGGGQERGRRSGTENVAGIVGLATALDRAQMIKSEQSDRLKVLRNQLLEGLKLIPDAIVNGDLTHRLPNNLNLTIAGAEGQALVLYLEQAGIFASTGSACSSGDLDPSHVLMAIGRTRDEAASSLRFTLGRDTTEQAIKQVIRVLPQIVVRVRELSLA